MIGHCAMGGNFRASPNVWPCKRCSFVCFQTKQAGRETENLKMKSSCWTLHAGPFIGDPHLFVDLLLRTVQAVNGRCGVIEGP